MKPEVSLCKCGNPRRLPDQRYCRTCHNQYMRENRSRHNQLNPEARLRANARSYAGVYLRRGKLESQPCKVLLCSEKAEIHHPDYTRPLDVEWLCRKHHLEHHQEAGL